MRSYSLHDIDLKILKYLEKIENGFYVEAGANDGFQQTNTLFYEKNYNWTGLLIEPNTLLSDRCKINRENNIVVNCALVSKDYKSDKIKGFFNRIDPHHSLQAQILENEYLRRDFWSNNSDIVEVPARTFQSIVDEYNIKKIDFFSLDVEGYEVNVMEGMNFSKIRPKYMLIESWQNQKESIENYMKNKNYKLLEYITVGNALYLDNL